MLALAQPLNSRFARGVGDQVKAADAFNGNDCSHSNHVRGERDCTVTLFQHLIRIKQFDVWAARRAGIWLGVEPAVVHIVIFRLAFFAHDEMFHRRVCAIIGKRIDDGEAGAAVGAVCEWIEITTIRWVENLAKAIVTGGNIWQHFGVLGAGGGAFVDFEFLTADRFGE